MQYTVHDTSTKILHWKPSQITCDDVSDDNDTGTLIIRHSSLTLTYYSKEEVNSLSYCFLYLVAVSTLHFRTAPNECFIAVDYTKIHCGKGEILVLHMGYQCQIRSSLTFTGRDLRWA